MMRNMRTTQKWRRLLRPVKNSAGMTMVEVLIAFAVLMLVLALANTAVQTSLNLSNMAEDVRQKTESVLTGYYRANRAASETSCSFGDFDLKTYPGVYNDETTGYSIYWFHDGKDHTPSLPLQGQYPAWLPKAYWFFIVPVNPDPFMQDASNNAYSSWKDWWKAVSPDCKVRWNELMGDRTTMMPFGWRAYIYINGATLCPP